MKHIIMVLAAQWFPCKSRPGELVSGVFADRSEGTDPP